MKKNNPAIIFLIVAAIGLIAGLFWYSSQSEEEAILGSEGMIILPVPVTISQYSLEEALAQRISVRSFKEDGITLIDISQLLWAGQGVSHDNKRTAPSAGALYPLELFLTGQIGDNVGTYHYSPENHRLDKVNSDDLRDKLAAASLNQDFIKEAPLVMIVTGIYQRTTGKYRERGIRYVQLEAGHVAQNIALQATALGLGLTPVGAFDDDQVRELLDLDEQYTPLYVLPIGHPK